jgi:hypothetical protein
MLSLMDDDAEARRAARIAAADWEFGIASHDDLSERDLARWLSQPASVRLQACFDVSREAWSIRAGSDTGPAYGIRRFDVA